MRRARPLCPILAAIVLAGCSSPAATPAAPTPVTSSPAAPSTAPAPSPSAIIPAVLKLGQTHKFTDAEFAAAVTPLRHKAFDGGYAVDVRTCNQGKAMFNASLHPWRLSYNGGEQLVDITIEGGGLPSPAFTARQLKPGKCARGWISFEAEAGAKPDGVEYHVDDITDARWEW